MDGTLAITLMALVPAALAIAVIDARTHRIPNRLLALAAAIAVVGATVHTAQTRSPDDAVRAATAAFIVGVVYLAMWRFADLGLGDVKLATALAIVAGWAGWSAVAAFVVVPHLLVLPLAAWRLARRRRGRIAFAPALVAGLYLAVAVAEING